MKLAGSPGKQSTYNFPMGELILFHEGERLFVELLLVNVITCLNSTMVFSDGQGSMLNPNVFFPRRVMFKRR